MTPPPAYQYRREHNGSLSSFHTTFPNSPLIPVEFEEQYIVPDSPAQIRLSRDNSYHNDWKNGDNYNLPHHLPRKTRSSDTRSGEKHQYWYNPRRTSRKNRLMSIFPLSGTQTISRGHSFSRELSPLGVLPRVYRSCPIESHYDFPVHSPRPKETITNSKQTMQYLIIIHHFNGKSCSKVPSNSFYFISKKFSSKKNRFMRVILLCNAPHQ